MREIWLMQPRFEKRSGATPYSLVEQARFRAAFDFMRLAAPAAAQADGDAEQPQASEGELAGAPRKRRRRRKPRTGGEAGSSIAAE
jgi:poly(A) polymerase